LRHRGAVTCRALEVSESWFYKWKDRPPTLRQQLRARVDADVKRSFDASGGDHGSPLIRWPVVVDATARH
jgi:putative transposase